jgi:uncharacterized membrane protein
MAKKVAKKQAKVVKPANKQDIGRLAAIFSYITPIGWVLALILNLNSKTALGSFHVRQGLMIFLCWMVLSWIPNIGWLFALILLVFLIMGLISAINGKEKEVPIIGSLAQKWFKGL